MDSLSVSLSLLCVLYLFDTSNSLEPLIIAWVEKPPYVTGSPNNSSENEARGIIGDVLLPEVLKCYHYNIQIDTIRVKRESDIFQKLKSGQAGAGGPVIAKGIDPTTYSGLAFVPMVDYPGADFITMAEPKQFAGVATEAVFNSWPLIAFTLILTAIAGVVTWALDTVTNPEEFPRSFLRGSWEGIWWSFISMTTVGYGDKAPKSILSRIFAMIWIQVGLIIMAVFMACITSELTTVSLEPDTKVFEGSTVAVIGNGTEYGIAHDSSAKPTVFKTFEDAMEALESKKVSGILVDRYTGYYHLTHKSRYTNMSLLTSDHIPFKASLGLVIPKEREYLVGCLSVFKNEIRKSAQAITSTYKAPKKKLPKTFSAFDTSNAGPLRIMLYISLGVLGLMLLAGFTWDLLCHKRKKTTISEEDHATEMSARKISSEEELRKDLDQGKRMLRQMQEYFEMLERKLQDRIY